MKISDRINQVYVLRKWNSTPLGYQNHFLVLLKDKNKSTPIKKGFILPKQNITLGFFFPTGFHQEPLESTKLIEMYKEDLFKALNKNYKSCKKKGCNFHDPKLNVCVKEIREIDSIHSEYKKLLIKQDV